MSRSLAVVIVDLRSCANVGQILRTAAAFGFTEVFTVGTTPPLSRKEVKKSSLGGERLSWQHYLDWSTFLKTAPPYHLIAIETGGQPILSSPHLATKEPIALVVGNERTGLSQTVLNDCLETVTVPQKEGVIKSLNVASAFAISSYLFSSYIK